MPKTPTTSSNDAQLRRALDRAIALNRAGKHREAVRLLLPLAKSHPRSAAVMGYLGGAYLELQDPARALGAFRRAVQLNPKSELASLGLFHSLWSQNSPEEAFAEMRRFLSLNDSV